MMRQRSAPFGAICALLLFNPAIVSATLLDGATIRATWRFPDLSGSVFSADVVVGPGTEIVPDLGGFGIDLSDVNIRFFNATSAAYTDAVFNGWHFFDFTGTIPSFTSVEINPATNMSNFNSSRIAFDADNIYVNLEGLALDFQRVISLDINGGIPEPSSFVLMGIGLAAIRCTRRKRSQWF